MPLASFTRVAESMGAKTGGMASRTGGDFHLDPVALGNPDRSIWKESHFGSSHTDPNRCTLLTMRFENATSCRGSWRFGGGVTPLTLRGRMSVSKHGYAIGAAGLANLATEAPLTG